MEVYTNPSNNQVILVYAKVRIYHGYEYKIYNQQGKLILEDSFDGYELLEVSGWSVGLYLVQIVDRKGSLVEVSMLMVD